MTVVHVIAGHLGSGKTTALLDQLTRFRGQRVAVVVNDFGEAAIDQAVLADAARGVALAEIEGACVCCTAPEGFTDAVGQLLDTAPDHLFVEPTGIARPSDVVDTLQRGPHRDRIAVAPLVVLVDPAALSGPHGPSIRAQAEPADVLVANRTDLCTEHDLAAFDAWAASIWPPPRIVRTAHGDLPHDVWSGSTRSQAHDHDHDPHHAPAAASWWWPAEARFSRDRLDAAFAALTHAARVKGLFRTPEGAWLLEIAGGRVHARVTGHRRDSRVDVLLDRPDPAALSAIRATFDAALLTPDELRVDPNRVEIVRPDGTRVDLDRSALAALPDPVDDVSALIPGRAGSAARVRAILDRLGIGRDTHAVVIAADGFASPPVPTEALDTAVLVHSLGSGALPDAQGGPFRLLIPGDAGPAGACSNVKRVIRIAVRAAD